MGRSSTMEPNGYRRYGRLAGYGTAGMAVGLALVMALTPVAGALKPHVINPPYKGSSGVQSRYISSGGTCKSAASVTGNHWIPKTGNMTAIVYSLAKACATPPTGNGYANAYTSDQFQVAIPVKIYTNTGHNFSANYSWAFTITASLTVAGGCPVAKYVPGSYTYSSCYADVNTYAYLQTELFDQTNSSYLASSHSYLSLPQNYSYQDNYSYCSSTGSCTNNSYAYSCHSSQYYQCAPSGSAVTGTNSTWINTGKNCASGYNGYCYYWHNWTLNSSHKYWLLTFLYVSADAYLYNWAPGSSAVASINGASLGNTGWRIASVTVT